MPRLVLLHVLGDLALDHRVVVFQADGAGLDDVGLWELAGGVVGDRDDGAVGDGWVS